MLIVKIFRVKVTILDVSVIRCVRKVYSDFQRSNRDKYMTSNCSMKLWKVILYTAEWSLTNADFTFSSQEGHTLKSFLLEKGYLFLEKFHILKKNCKQESIVNIQIVNAFFKHINDLWDLILHSYSRIYLYSI